jgi:hypothetical protein
MLGMMKDTRSMKGHEKHDLLFLIIPLGPHDLHNKINGSRVTFLRGSVLERTLMCDIRQWKEGRKEGIFRDLPFTPSVHGFVFTRDACMDVITIDDMTIFN